MDKTHGTGHSKELEYEEISCDFTSEKEGKKRVQDVRDKKKNQLRKPE